MKAVVLPAVLLISLAEAKALYKAEGPTWPVVEVDLMELLEARVAEARTKGLFKEAEQRKKEHLREHAKRPVALDLPRSQRHRTVVRTLWDTKRLLSLPDPVREHVTGLVRSYVFLNAEDASQVKWLLKNAPKGDHWVVIVRGDRYELERRLKQTVYADQGGTLVRRFSIDAVPAVVTLQAERVTVEYPDLSREDCP